MGSHLGVRRDFNVPGTLTLTSEQFNGLDLRPVKRSIHFRSSGARVACCCYNSRDMRNIGTAEQRPVFGGLLARVESLAECISTGLDHNKYLLLSLYTAAYFWATCYRASRKLFWFDEIQMVHISRLPDVKSIWGALLQAVDFSPPLGYILTHLSVSAVGSGHIGARLPAIVGFWVFTLCLFRFVSLRTNALAGFISLLFPLVTTAYAYAYEARAYGIELGFCGLALVGWQHAAAKQERRFWSLAAMFLGLAGALLSHSYALMMFIPLFFGEVTRFTVTKRLDRTMWSTLVASSPALLFSVVSLHSLKSHSFYEVLHPMSLALAALWYREFFGPAILVLIIALVLICISQLISSNVTTAAALEPYELVVVVGFLAIPYFSLLASRIIGAPLWPRYSIIAVAGLICLLSVTVARNACVGLIVFCSLVAQIGTDFVLFRQRTSMKEPSTMVSLSTSRMMFDERYQWMSADPHKDLPVILLDNLEFAQTFYYAPPSLISRLVYIASGDANAVLYGRLQNCCGAPGNLVETITPKGAWLAYGPSRAFSFLGSWQQAGATIQAERIDSDHGLFLVTYPPGAVSGQNSMPASK